MLNYTTYLCSIKNSPLAIAVTHNTKVNYYNLLFITEYFIQ